MVISGTEIRVQRASWFEARRAGLVGAALVLTLAAGHMIGRDSAPSATTTGTVAVSTRWIDDTSVRNEVMEAMNGVAVARAPMAGYLETGSVGPQVMEHMNDLSLPPGLAGFKFGNSVQPAVMKHMNELLGS